LEHSACRREVVVRLNPGEFTNLKDPVLDAALAYLRKASESERTPGKRV